MLLERALERAVKNDITYKSLTVEDLEKAFKAAAVGEVDQKMASGLSAVSAAHRIYTNAIAMLPWMIRRRAGDERHEASLPVERVLKERANEAMSPFKHDKIVASQAFWWGCGFSYIRRNKRGEVEELIPLPSKGWQRYYDRETDTTWYGFEVPDDTDRSRVLQRKFLPSELLIFPFECYDGLTGHGVMDLASSAIKTDKAAQQYNEKFYVNGARVSGIVTVEGDLSEESKAIVRADFERKAHGMDNAFRVAVLDLGMKYQPLGTTQQDAQYIESREFFVDEIARFTGIPSYMLQAGKQSYQSNEQQQLDFVINTLTAPVTSMEQEWSYKLLGADRRKEGYYLKKNMAQMLRGDNKTRSEFYDKMISIGAMCQDDVRALEDMSPLPDGQGSHFWITKNYDSIENMIKAPGAQGGQKEE